MKKNYLEKERIESSKFSFREKLNGIISNLDNKKAVIVTKTGGDGPLISINQEGKQSFYLEVYHGINWDYRPEFAFLAKKILIGAGFPVL